MKHLEDLNDAQREAATHKDGPILIVAGAGAGKTKTIVHRIANLIKEGVSPQNILAITFTNKAASELKERVRALLRNAEYQIKDTGNQVSNIDKNNIQYPYVSTFHSLCVNILRNNAQEIGRTKYFKILDQNESLNLIKQSMKESDLDPKQYAPKYFQNVISRMKGEMITLDKFKEMNLNYMENLAVKVWQKYSETLQKEKSFDFDDLLLETVLLFRKYPKLLKQYQNQFQYLHIDEYQDTNLVQYELTRQLSEKHKNICAVGDMDQCIYGFRGANFKNILTFERDYPGAKTVMLEENYRSTQNILDAANEIIKKNKARVDKNLFTQKGEGEKISLYTAIDEKDEADYVAGKVLEIMDQSDQSGQSNLSNRSNWSDIAVLYRANFQSRVLEESMISLGIPYQVLGVKFYERKEVKDVLAYLSLALNPESLSDLKRVINFPPRGIGKISLLKIFAGRKNELSEKLQISIIRFYESLEKIKKYAEAHSVSETIKFLLAESGIEKFLKTGNEEDLARLENLRELASLAKKYDTLGGLEGINKILEDAALMSDQDNIEENREGIKLMTVHAAKGLEFKYVFIVGLEQGLFPHQKMDTEEIKDPEEERRLFYVALTRAMKKIYLSYAGIRTIFGSRNYTMPSEFLSDLPERLIELEETNKLRSIYLN